MPTLTLEGPVEEREIALNFFRQMIPNNSILWPKIELLTPVDAAPKLVGTTPTPTIPANPSGSNLDPSKPNPKLSTLEKKHATSIQLEKKPIS